MEQVFNLNFTVEDLENEKEINVQKLARSLKDMAREELRNRISKLELGHIGFRLDSGKFYKANGYQLGVTLEYSVIYDKGVLKFVVKAKIKDEDRVEFTLDRKWTVTNLKKKTTTEMSIQSLRSENTRNKIDEFLQVS